MPIPNDDDLIDDWDEPMRVLPIVLLISLIILIVLPFIGAYLVL